VALIAKGAGIDLDAALDDCVRRFERLRKSGLDLSRATFATEFGRNLEYYSGLVFQIEVGDERNASQIAGGGRYDGLLANIGAPRDVPAIGSAIHTERLLAAVERIS
jgi:ATP phosphoribosyltransferase regulatory subunit